MKRPLWNAFPTSWPAKPASCSGSAVEAMTKSTGKPLPPGRGGGVSEMTRTPAIFEDFAAASICRSWVERFRALQGFVTMPPKPPLGEVIWKMLSLSGKDR